jgi:hypothetical protein
VKRLIAAALIALAAAACGGAGSAEPTARPIGHRGTLLNPIDKARSTVDQLNDQQRQQDQQTGGSAGTYP